MDMLQGLRTFFITNKKSGNALDLSDTDHISIIGYPYHGRVNQEWTLLDDTCNGRFGTPGGITRWNILSGTTGNCLNFEGEPRDGVKVIATHSAMVLEIIPVGDHEPDHYRIFLPSSNLFFTLSSDDSCTPVELRRETGGEDQIWKFEQTGLMLPKPGPMPPPLPQGWNN